MITFQIVYLFVLAMIFALIEIEAEGRYGWAEKMPTWYRTRGLAARIYGLIMGGKPLTGYHSYMFVLPLLMFHMPYLHGTTWTLVAELQTFAVYLVWAPLWDFLWFVLNPAYGIGKFKKENIWWHRKSFWVLGIFPIDYLVGLVVGILLTGISCYLSESPFPAIEYFLLTVGLFALTIVTIILSPLYHKWRSGMDARDDRQSAQITHPPKIFGQDAG